MKQLNIKEYAIVADFDGTITWDDSNDLLFLTHGNGENEKIEAEYCAGIASGKDTMFRHFQAKRLGFQEYFEFLDSHLRIDPGFDGFLQHLRMHDIPLFIVSGGYRQGILRILGAERAKDVQIFANDLLEENGYLIPSSATKETVCTEPIGPCDNCKKVCLETIRRQTNQKILFIGDGTTDRCAAKHTDVLFAKDGHALAEYCRTHHLPYIPYTGFDDITSYLWDDNL